MPLSGVALLLAACAEPIDLDSPVGTWEYSSVRVAEERMQNSFNKRQMKRFLEKVQSYNIVFTIEFEADGTLIESFDIPRYQETPDDIRRGTWKICPDGLLAATYNGQPPEAMTLRFERTRLIRLGTPDPKTGEVHEIAYGRIN